VKETVAGKKSRQASALRAFLLSLGNGFGEWSGGERENGDERPRLTLAKGGLEELH